LQTYQRRRGLWCDQLAWYHSGLETAQRLGRRQDEGAILNEIGLVYANLGQEQQAFEYFQKALPIQEEVGDQAGESVTRYNMAAIYRAQGRLAEAVTELRRVVALDRMVQHPDLESDMALLAEVEAKLGAGRPADG
jgi:tetratricopeptide (TPR) repeat protein